jgi:hypothetical protein
MTTYNYINPTEKKARLYCTPGHVTKALLKREYFPGSIWEPAAGRGDIVKVLRDCNYPDIHASDLNDWGFKPCLIDDFLESNHESDCLVTNPPFNLKAAFLERAKQIIRHKIALLLPIEFEYTTRFIQKHEYDKSFPWKAIYAFPQSIKWLNVNVTWGMVHVAWYVFERNYSGDVHREKIRFLRNK